MFKDHSRSVRGKLLPLRFFDAGRGGDLCSVGSEAGWEACGGGCVHCQPGDSFHAKQAGNRQCVVGAGDGGDGRGGVDVNSRGGSSQDGHGRGGGGGDGGGGLGEAQAEVDRCAGRVGRRSLDAQFSHL